VSNVLLLRKKLFKPTGVTATATCEDYGKKKRFENEQKLRPAEFDKRPAVAAEFTIAAV